MRTDKLSPQSLLSTLWIFILFNMIFRDLHQFASEGFIQEIMNLKVSEVELLIYGVLLEIPISMVLLSRILKVKLNKWVNLFAAIISMLGLFSTIPQTDLDDLFFMAVQVVAYFFIIRTALRLPQTSKISLKA